MKTKQPEVQRLVYSIAEAAEALRVSRATLYRMANDGDLHVTKVRGRSVITVKEAERLLKA